jgi:hypothetical protein
MVLSLKVVDLICGPDRSGAVSICVNQREKCGLNDYIIIPLEDFGAIENSRNNLNIWSLSVLTEKHLRFLLPFPSFKPGQA